MKKNFYAPLLVVLLSFLFFIKIYYDYPILSYKLFNNNISYFSLQNLNYIHIHHKNAIKLYLFFFILFLLLAGFLIVKHNLRVKQFHKEITTIQNLLNEIESQNKEIKNKLSELFLSIKKELNHLKTDKKIVRDKLILINNQIYFIIIAEILIKQKKDLKRINTLEAQNLYKNTEKIQATGNIFILQKYITKNNQWITDYWHTRKAIKHIIEKLKKGLYVEGITNLLLNELQNIKDEYTTLNLEDIKYRISKQLTILQGKNSTTSIILIKNEIKNILAELENYILFENYWIYSKRYLTYNLQLSDFSNCFWDLSYNLKKIKQQLYILSILKEINILSTEYKQNIDYINRENNLKIDKNIVKTLYTETNKKNLEIARKINDYIALFFTSIPKEDLHLISTILKITNFKSQNAKILVLLLADKKIKRTIIPGILDVYSNLNPIISRLINDKIKNNQKNLEKYKEKNIFSIISKLILDLLK